MCIRILVLEHVHEYDLDSPRGRQKLISNP
jgi:hypothetical protein